MVSTASVQSEIQFTDITQSSRIDFFHENGAFGLKWMPETMGSGAGFFDYNNDGLPDLFLVNSNYWPGHAKSQISPTQKLYRRLKIPVPPLLEPINHVPRLVLAIPDVILLGGVYHQRVMFLGAAIATVALDGKVLGNDFLNAVGFLDGIDVHCLPRFQE